MSDLAKNIASRLPQDAANALAPLIRFAEAAQGAAVIVDLLMQSVQIASELDTAIAKKRAELAASTTKAIDGAKLEGQQQRDRIIDEGRSLAGKLTAQAVEKLRDADTAVEAKRTELADLEAKIAKLKDHARGLAG